MPTPALDFLEKVRTWQEADGASAGLPLVIPGSAQDRLSAILADMDRGYSRADLETRARRWLIGYHELVSQQGGLTAEQKRELNSIVTCIPLWDARQRRQHNRQRPWYLEPAFLVVALIALIGITLSVSALLIGSDTSGPPPAGPVAAAPAGPQAGALTELQQFRADWNVPKFATANSGSALALVLLQDGLYYPVPWYLLNGGTGWEASTSASISSAEVTASGTANVTDGDGITYTVVLGQPFVLSADPTVIFRVLRDGTIQSMPGSHAITIRHRI